MLKAAMVHKGGSNMEAVSYCVVYTVKSGQRDAFVQEIFGSGLLATIREAGRLSGLRLLCVRGKRRPPYADGKLGQ